MLPGVCAVVFNDEDEVLLGKRSDTGGWALIAGAIDPGEQPADAILREIREEAGIAAIVERLIGVASHPVVYPNQDRIESVSVWFRCRAVDGHARAADEESVDMQWFPIDGLPEISAWTRLVIETALKDDQAAWFVPAGTQHVATSTF
jgi:8-oxo-dGTP diphosphatase